MEVSYIGFMSQNIKAIYGQDINITLKEDAEILEEVVVVGYGSQKKSDVTGAIATVMAKDIENIPVNDFGSALAGRSAGVQVITPSGKPNGGFSIRVRGVTSINAGNEPLYVVDGVPTSDTKSINPSEIENITVLKDASSAAIYGNAGANGVVLITTKKGRKGEAKVELNAYYGVPYWTTNVLCTVCRDCGNIDPNTLMSCPKCGSKNIDYGTRVIGYLKLISNFSKGRQVEANKRFYQGGMKLV